MSNTFARRALQYLPVDIGGQLFAIPVSDVTAIQQRGPKQAGEQAEPTTGEEPAARVPVVDMCKLFWGAELPEAQGFVITLSTPAGVCALAVSRVYPADVAEAQAQRPLPFPLDAAGSVFAGFVGGPALPTLIVDCERLTEMIAGLAPQLVVEAQHAR